MSSISSREQGRGSGRKRAPESAVFATISSADAMATSRDPSGGGTLFGLLWTAFCLCLA